MKKSYLSIVIIIIFTIGIITISGCQNQNLSRNGYDYLVLVNKYTQLPDDWEKNVKLVNTKNAWKEDIKVEKEAFEQYKKLKKDLKKKGVNIELDSVYRSVKDQQDLWDEWSKDPEKGLEYVKKFVAVPGFSEHHTGLAIDICIKKNGKLIYDNDEMIAEKKIFSKIHKELANYGFILRYMKEREDSTGYTYEPWHLRYVGSKKIAKEIMNKNITFEEYLEKTKDIKKVNSAAKMKIETTLQDYFKEVYGKKISNSRFNITKIYTDKEVKNNKLLKSLKIGKKDIAFEVTYQLQPSKGTDPNKLTIPDGEYDKKLGWVKNIKRVGVLKYNKKTDSYTIKNFGTGW